MCVFLYTENIYIYVNVNVRKICLWFIAPICLEIAIYILQYTRSTVILKYSEIQRVYIYIYIYIYIYMTTCALCNCIHYVEMISLGIAHLQLIYCHKYSCQWDESSRAYLSLGINSKGVLHAVLIGPIGDFLCQMHRQDTCTSHELHLPVVKSYVTRVRLPENHSCFIKTSKAMSLLRPTMTSSFQCNILDGGHWEIDDIFSSPKHSATSARNLNPETPSLPSWQMSFACVFGKFGQHKVISLLAGQGLTQLPHS